MQRKYAFSWNLIGDMDNGRPNLGPTVRLEMYRLMQYCLRDAMETELGSDATDMVFCNAGKIAGKAFFQRYFPTRPDVNGFIREVQGLLLCLGVGVLRVEEAAPGLERLVLTVSEDADCSGLPDTQEEICTFDEGFLAGLLQAYSGQEYSVKEIDCWCTGDRTCRFVARREAGTNP
uniref:4-vinyl reductase n=1 Tax=Fundidesulfovibrio putealis TaxID=270496 RepID=A0A7C4ENZ5_9BACT